MSRFSFVVFCCLLVTFKWEGAECHECRAERWFRIMDAILRNHHHHKKQVAFFARFKTSFTMSASNKPLVFNDVITNVGNGYSGQTGVFTAPEAGIYNFQWTMLPYHGNTFHSKLFWNGAVVIFNHATAQKSSRTTSTMATLSLKKGDRVWIQKYGGNKASTNGGVYAAFQGFKI